MFRERHSPILSGVVALMRNAAPPGPELLDRPGAYCRLVSECLRKTARLDVLGLVEPNNIVGQGLVDCICCDTDDPSKAQKLKSFLA